MASQEGEINERLGPVGENRSREDGSSVQQVPQPDQLSLDVNPHPSVPTQAANTSEMQGDGDACIGDNDREIEMLFDEAATKGDVDAHGDYELGESYVEFKSEMSSYNLQMEGSDASVSAGDTGRESGHFAPEEATLDTSIPLTEEAIGDRDPKAAPNVENTTEDKAEERGDAKEYAAEAVDTLNEQNRETIESKGINAWNEDLQMSFIVVDDDKSKAENQNLPLASEASESEAKAPEASWVKQKISEPETQPAVEWKSDTTNNSANSFKDNAGDLPSTRPVPDNDDTTNTAPESAPKRTLSDTGTSLSYADDDTKRDLKEIKEGWNLDDPVERDPEVTGDPYKDTERDPTLLKQEGVPEGKESHESVATLSDATRRTEALTATESGTANLKTDGEDLKTRSKNEETPREESVDDSSKISSALTHGGREEGDKVSGFKESAVEQQNVVSGERKKSAGRVTVPGTVQGEKKATLK